MGIRKYLEEVLEAKVAEIVSTGDSKREEETINRVIKNQDHDEAIKLNYPA